MSARKVALVAFDDSPVRLYGLIARALKQGAAVVLVCDVDAEGLPDDVEIQPLSALDDVLKWADYTAFDVERENLFGLRERLGGQNQMSLKSEAQVFIHTPVPCGGIAECGVCSVVLKSGWKLACRDGLVFDSAGNLKPNPEGCCRCACNALIVYGDVDGNRSPGVWSAKSNETFAMPDVFCCEGEFLCFAVR